MKYGESENLYLAMGCDPNAHLIACGSTNCDDRGESPGGISQFFKFSDYKSGQ